MGSKKSLDIGGNVIGTSAYPRIKAFKSSPETEALVKKLITDRSTAGNPSAGRKNQPPSEGVVRNVSDKTTQNIHDNSNIFQLLPDTELAMQILISSILSPKDMITVEMGYKSNSKVVSGELSGQMLEVIRQHFDENYKIKSILPKILEEALFKKGSYPLLVLPESSIDAIINGDGSIGMESLSGEVYQESKLPRRSIGILGSSEEADGGVSLESFMSMSSVSVDETKTEVTVPWKIDLGKVYVSDNYNTLKFPRLMERVREQRVSSAVGIRSVSIEARRKKGEEVDENDIYRSLFKNKNYRQEGFINITPGTPGSGVGHPLIVRLPPESIIPVHTPGNPEDHVGYFILLDQYGNPLNRMTDTDYYRDLSTNISASGITSQLLESGSRSVMGRDDRYNKQLEVSEAVRLYSEIVEKDLLARLKNGIYGENIDIARPQDVYQVMLARSLAQKSTQILYVPAEMVTYYAFDYNHYGVGKSLLENGKILASIRAMLLFSNTMASIKNSTPKTGVKIELSPDDPDPSGTVEFLLHEYTKNRQNSYPLGASNPLDIIDFLQNAGVDVQVSGNEMYPETSVDFEDYATSKVEIDSALEEDLKRKHYMTFGLSPETVDMSSDIEFATSVVTSNLLLAKRVILYQDKLCEHTQNHIGRYVTSSGILWDELTKLVEGGKSNISKDFKAANIDDVIMEFLQTLEVTLPRPESAKIENQMASYNLYSEFLESAIDAYINEDFLNLDGFDDVEGAVSAVRYAVLSHFKREWLRNNNVLPELMDIVLSDAENKPTLNIEEVHGNHLEALGKSVNELIIRLKKDQAKREHNAENADSKLEEQKQKWEEEANPEEESDVGADGGEEETDTGEADVGDEEPAEDDTIDTEEGDADTGDDVGDVEEPDLEPV